MSERVLMGGGRSDPRYGNINGTSKRKISTRFWRSWSLRTKILVVAVVVLVIVIAVIIGCTVGSRKTDADVVPDPVTDPLPSPSILRVFKKAAICSDSPQCSEVGRDILKQNGSAVDAAIATMFCNGLLNQQSMGIGGGFFMVVYLKQERKAYSVIAREKAPAKATKDMFHGDDLVASRGGLAVGIPGEVHGLWEAHKRWGQLPWKNLIAPAIDICNNGFNMSQPLRDGLDLADPYIKNDHNLGEVYYDSRSGNYYPVGTWIKLPPAFCNTLARLADKGGDDFYNGSLASDIVQDLQKVGSIITLEDFKNYSSKISDPIAVPLKDGDTLYTTPLPSSGVLLANILNILSGYNFTADSVKDAKSQILTYHRIIEAFKYAYATRTKLGDDDYLKLKDNNIMQLVAKAVSPEYGSEIRHKIDDNRTSNNMSTYGAEEYVKPDHGTAHISIIAENGDAVTITSSINYYFGACFTTRRTGIVMNNVMDDFSSPGITNYFGLKPSPANFIEPGKRPLSSISPSIIVDRNGDAKLVIGASGGTKITTAVALVTMRKLWFDLTLKEAVDAPRLHHQIFPMDASYEFGILRDVVQGLRDKGHIMIQHKTLKAIVCALYRNGSEIYGNADFRKGGEVMGID